MTIVRSSLCIFTLMVASLALTSCDAGDDNNNSSSVSDDNQKFIADHANDPAALQDKFSIEANSACSVGADEYLRTVALHDFKWDEDAQGFLGVKFGHYSSRSAGPGLLTLSTTSARLQNGFGAFDTFKFYCLYDVKNDKVVKYTEDDPADSLPDTSAPPVQEKQQPSEAQPSEAPPQADAPQTANDDATQDGNEASGEAGGASDGVPHPVSGWH